MSEDGLSENLTAHVRYLKKEVDWLRRQLRSMQEEKNTKMNTYFYEERQLREENIRLQQQLNLEKERREALSRQLSESESSLEMDDDARLSLDAPGASFMNINSTRPRTVSSPIPYSGPNRSVSPGMPMTGITHSNSGPSSGTFTPPSPLYRTSGSNTQSSSKTHGGTASSLPNQTEFIKPSPPPSPSAKPKQQSHDQ